MNSEIKKILKKIEKNGFEAYIVGGFVRNYLLSRESNDVDICTNALPKDIQTIFGNSRNIGNYGSYNFKTNQYNYDITTYRKEKEYIKRHPSKIEYTTNLLEDLKRRDFTMNAICMNQQGQIIDLLNGTKDIENKKIRSIGDSTKKIKEDPLRILRAIRFACILDFEIESTLWETIRENRNLVLNLSNFRIKKELDLILLSPNFAKGFKILESLGILELLEIEIPLNITYVEDINGMWAQINPKKDFGFSKVEKKQIKNIKEILKYPEITSWIIWEYGLYPALIAAKINHIPEIQIMKIAKQMKIQKRSDLSLSFAEIQNLTKKEPKEIKKIENWLIQQILEGKLENKKQILKEKIQEGVKKYEL